MEKATRRPGGFLRLNQQRSEWRSAGNHRTDRHRYHTLSLAV